MPEIGQRIGPFELVERLGAGHGTSVYRAERIDRDREPATVVVRAANALEDGRAVESVRAEYEALRSMSDPRIPEVYGFYAGQGALALRWYPGITLTDACQARRDGLVRIDARTAIDIVIEIAHALRHAHGQRGDSGAIVHGHLGSQRVRLAISGEVVVTGFGANAKGRHTAYTSPEMAAGELPDARSDQWALGAIAVELLLGERLYDNLTDTRVACLEGRVEPWVSRIERAWPGVGRILRRMLSADNHARFDSDQELIRELLAAERDLPGVADRAALVGQVLRFYDRLSATRPPTPSVLPPKAEDDEPALPAPRRKPDRNRAPETPQRPPPPEETVAAITPVAEPSQDVESTSDPPSESASDPTSDTDSVVAATPFEPPHARLDLSALGGDLPEPKPVDLSDLDIEAELGHFPSLGGNAELVEEINPPEAPPPKPIGIPDFQPTELVALATGGLLVLVGVIYLVATIG